MNYNLNRIGSAQIKGKTLSSHVFKKKILVKYFMTSILYILWYDSERCLCTLPMRNGAHTIVIQFII